MPRRTSIQEGPTGVAAAMGTPKQQAGYSAGEEAARLFNGQSCKGPQTDLDQRSHEVVTQWATRLRDQPY